MGLLQKLDFCHVDVLFLLLLLPNSSRMNLEATTTRQELYRELNESLKATIESARSKLTIDEIIDVATFYEDSFLDNLRRDDESATMSNIEFVNKISDREWIDYIRYMKELLAELNDRSADHYELNKLLDELN